MSLGVNKQGQLQTNSIEEYIYEPDGSKWFHVFHHNNPSINLFSSSDTFSTGVYKSKDIWFNFNICNKITSNWEILLMQYTTPFSDLKKYRWIQTANPLTATYADVAAASITKNSSNGYATAASSYGGIYLKNSRAYLLANNGNSSNWYGAIGSWTGYQGGIPGYNGATITTGGIDIYVRIDNLNITANVSRLQMANTFEFYEY